MRVVFCVRDHRGKYRVTAYGDLEGISERDKIGNHIGEVLPFVIEQDFGDIPRFAERLPTGILSSAEDAAFYEFEVISGSGTTGELVVRDLAEEQGCVPADAK